VRKVPHLRVSGLSLLELLVAVALGVLLISLAIPLSSLFLDRAKKARCISNMRVLHSALAAHVTDKGHWPQMEKDRFNFTEEEFFEFWVKATDPYGMSQEAWLCPMDRALSVRAGKMEDRFYGSYNVTRFDESPATPFRWNQPWAMERGNFHGRGVHILMPDGSVNESMNPFAGR